MTSWPACGSNRGTTGGELPARRAVVTRSLSAESALYSVDAVIADKYGPQGRYGDAATFAAPFKNSADADEYLRQQVGRKH